MSYLKIAGKWLAVLVAVAVGTVVGGMLGLAVFHPVLTPPPPHDGPLDVTQSMLLVSAVFAVLLSLIASRLRGSFWLRALVLFGVVYTITTVQSLDEAVYFRDYVKLSMPGIYMSAVSGLVRDALSALVAAWVWRGADGETERFTGLWWRVALIAPIYVVFYFAAGAWIAFQGEALRAYYDQGAHIDQTPLILFQVFRSLIWSAAAFAAVRQMTGPGWSRALIVGFSFSLFMATVLFVPNGFMLWDVRKFHMAEIGVSNLLFGFVAASILLGGRKIVTSSGD
ncbi:hypothetical protein [Asticcacaulis solisilvae]|uniref:hypothetical protein n=1 Tax=Asticcacaulis solisilvae TaxID=1217274 RepID=UPI003FD7942D